MTRPTGTILQRRGDDLKIAIAGTRGIPGNYGGFETFAEELSARLVADGHSVTVYCRTRNAEGDPPAHRGVRLVHLPAIRHKYLETLSHTFLSLMHAAFSDYDIVYVCNSANSPLCFIPWVRRQRTILNVDGLEWRRRKWGWIARRYYRWAAKLAAHMPIEVVTDAEVIRDYYLRVWKRATGCFAYGTALYDRGHLSDRLARLGVQPGNYILYVSRLEPENNALLVVEGYRRVETDVPLVIVGDAPYAGEYIARVKEAADDRVRFLGYQFGDDYHALQASALFYVQATEVGGTHPALVEALGHQNAVLAHDVPEHREVVQDAGRYFRLRDAEDLASQMRDLLAAPAEIARLRQLARHRVEDSYSWDAVTTAYEQFFDELMARPR